MTSSSTPVQLGPRLMFAARRQASMQFQILSAFCDAHDHRCDMSDILISQRAE
jgi:hypothetical protein